MREYKIEVCCGSVEDAISAKIGGADRIELNSALFLGGLTPSIGEMKLARQSIDLPIMAMVRPRQGGFCYTDMEYKTAIADAEALLDCGADGLVFGFLNPDGTVDCARVKEFVRLAGNREKVFHRAIDVVPDWKKTLSVLIDLGVDRVLTSGQESNVLYGAETIREMIEFARGRIQILPGGGIRANLLPRILRETGCDQIHIAASKQRFDTSAQGNPHIYFGGALYPPEDCYSAVDAEAVRRF